MSVLLIDDVTAYVAHAAIEPITSGQYFRSVKCYSRHLGRPARRNDLQETSINAWLNEVAKRLAPFTVLGRKRGITPTWNWLAIQGLVPWYNPRALRKTKAAYPPVRAWSIAQVHALLNAAEELPGRLKNGIAASDLMVAYVRLAYESGLRPSDMLRLTPHDFQDGRILIVQHKTKFPHSMMLSADTIASLRLIERANATTTFGLTKGGLRRWELCLFACATKHGFSRQKRQACGTLRKTHGTEVCRAEGLPAAAMSLGHVDGIRVARQSYCEVDAIFATKPPTALINALAKPTQEGQRNHRRRA